MLDLFFFLWIKLNKLVEVEIVKSKWSYGVY